MGVRWVRLVGVSLGNLTHDAFQLTLDEGWRDIALGAAVDKVREKYGFAALGLAARPPLCTGEDSSGRARRAPESTRRTGTAHGDEARPSVLDFTLPNGRERPPAPALARPVAETNRGEPG